jgi:hypothetical protein
VILTDGVHLVSDIPGEEGECELHAFASKLRFRKDWFQRHPVHPHYDLTTARASRRATAAGATMTSSRAIAAMFLKRRVQ